MIKKTITYTDYNGVSRTEDFWFNLTTAELMKMELMILSENHTDKRARMEKDLSSQRL